MGIVTTPVTALAASLITWYSFTPNSTRVQVLEHVATGSSAEVFAEAERALLEAHGQQPLAEELLAAFKERDARIAELEAAAGGATTTKTLSEWRIALRALALFGATGGEAEFPQAAAAGEELRAGFCQDALGAFTDAHIGIAMLLRDAAQDAVDSAAELIWPWPVDSGNALPIFPDLQLEGQLRNASALLVASIDESMPPSLRALCQRAWAELSARHMKLQASVGEMAAGLAERHPQHRATLSSSDPVLLVAHIVVFVLLVCWEVYGIWRLLAAVARRLLGALFCCRRRRPSPQAQATSTAEVAAGSLSPPAATFSADIMADVAQASQASDAVLKSKGPQRAVRPPLRALNGEDKENIDDSLVYI